MSSWTRLTIADLNDVFGVAEKRVGIEFSVLKLESNPFDQLCHA
jgi:hypothetical protein